MTPKIGEAMKWYNHQNRSVVISVDGDCCTYYEVMNGEVRETKTVLLYFHEAWIEEGCWLPLTEMEARNILSYVLRKKYPSGYDLALLFTEIDIHMFSSGEANEL